MQPNRDLERELRDLGSRVEYPSTPDLARAVRNRLDEGEEPAPHQGWSDLPVVRWAAVAAVVLIAAVPVLSPALRDTVAGWFDGGQASTGGAGEAISAGGGGEASRATPDSGSTPMNAEGGSRAGVPQSGGGSMMPSSGGRPRSSGGNLGYGERIPLREAQSRLAGNEPLLPGTGGLGAPDEVYASESPAEEGVTLVYHARPGLPPLGNTGIGLVLTELPGGVESAYLPEGVSAVPAEVEGVSVGDGRAYWVPTGRGVRSPIGRTESLGGSVVLWEQEGVALRLEADVPKREAIRIAESVG